MESSLRIVPGPLPKSASVQSTSNSLGLHDTLQYGPRSLAAEVQSAGGLKGRLENVRPFTTFLVDSIFNTIFQWETTQDNLKLTLERNLYGMHAPMRRLMERRIVASVSHESKCIESSHFSPDASYVECATNEPSLGYFDGPR